MPEAERDHAITLTRAGKCSGEGLTSPFMGRNDINRCNLQQKGYHKSETGKSLRLSPASDHAVLGVLNG